jgi:hypothetical protein
MWKKHKVEVSSRVSRSPRPLEVVEQGPLGLPEFVNLLLREPKLDTDPDVLDSFDRDGDSSFRPQMPGIGADVGYASCRQIDF